MNASQLARQAYAPTAFPLKSPRAVEAQVLAQVTARLRSAAKTAKADFPKYVHALNDNLRLWLLLASDVADGDNELPQQLRAQIFYLAEFTQQHTLKALRKEVDAQALIDINTSVLRGLNAGKAR